MVIRKALNGDSEALIELTRLAPMKGRISLRIDRKPDFFSLLKERGDYLVLVAENEQGKIIGSFSAARQQFVTKEGIVPVYYLGDLKVHPGYNKLPVAHRLIKAMQKEICSGEVDLFLFTAAEGNDSVTPFFEGRTGFPSFSQASIFNVYQLLPKRSNQKIALTNNTCQPELQNFYNDFYKRYGLYPVIENMSHCRHLTITENDKIIGAVSLFDPGKLKQNVVIDYPFSIGLALTLLRGLKSFVSLPAIPAKGSELNILYIKYFGFADEQEEEFIKLIAATRDFAYHKKYHFVSIAVDDKDEMINKLIRPLSRFNFRSTQLITSLGRNSSLIENISKSITCEDYSLV